MNTESENRLTAFLESKADSYAIFQLKRTDDNTDFRFMPYRYLEAKGVEPTIACYDTVYNGVVERVNNGITAFLEGLYAKFNLNRPKDFCGHSLSVSDVVGLKIDGKISFYYVDSIGFVELQNFAEGF